MAIISHGYFGVDLFFLLSGYVIALNCAGKLANPDLGSWCSISVEQGRTYLPASPDHSVAVRFDCRGCAAFRKTRFAAAPIRCGYFFLSLALVQNWGFTRLLEWNLAEGVLARIMRGRLIVYLGVTSYSTYMIHIFIREWATSLLRPGPIPGFVLPLCLALTAALSLPLYRLVEVPGRRAVRSLDLAGILRASVEFGSLVGTRGWRSQG